MEELNIICFVVTDQATLRTRCHIYKHKDESYALFKQWKTCGIRPCASPLAFGVLFHSRDRVGRDGRKGKGRGRGKEGLVKLAKARLVR